MFKTLEFKVLFFFQFTQLLRLLKVYHDNVYYMYSII